MITSKNTYNQEITSPVKHAQESCEKPSSLLMVYHVKNVTALKQPCVQINNPQYIEKEVFISQNTKDPLITDEDVSILLLA